MAIPRGLLSQLRGLWLFVKAVRFALRKHRGQRRLSGAPYIVHPLGVVFVLLRAGVRDWNVLAAAVLHDVMEQTSTTFEELLEAGFGEPVAEAVRALTDDNRLERAERKRLQIEGAPALPYGAKLVRLADKIGNIVEMPAAWVLAHRLCYVGEARRVREALRGTHARLEAMLDRACEQRTRRLDRDGGSLAGFLLGLRG